MYLVRICRDSTVPYGKWEKHQHWPGTRQDRPSDITTSDIFTQEQRQRYSRPCRSSDEGARTGEQVTGAHHEHRRNEPSALQGVVETSVDLFSHQIYLRLLLRL